jgi:hypothetical protein
MLEHRCRNGTLMEPEESLSEWGCWNYGTATIEWRNCGYI